MDHFLLEQLKYEAEGAEAAHEGKKFKDCPYNKATQSLEWNHWIYGRDNEEHKILMAKIPEEEKQGLWLTTSASDEDIQYVRSKRKKLRKKYA